MPKYKITEVDNTGSLTLSEQPNIVYIPGAASQKTEPTLLKTPYDLSNSSEEGGMKEKYGLLEDDSYLLAKKLLNLGMQVLYQGFERTGNVIEFSGDSFTIGDITYTLEKESDEYTGNVTWTEDSEAKSSAIASNGLVILADDLHAKITLSSTPSGSYPVAEQTLSTSIYVDEEDYNKEKFKIDGIVYTLGDNSVTWNTSTANVVNGEVTLDGGMPASIDYTHNLVVFKKLVSTEGSIAILDSDWELLQDKNLYNFRFLSTGAYACPSTSMLTCVEKRGDCIALIDHAKPSVYDVDDIREEFKPYCSKYAAGFTPWFTCRFDTIESEVPASFGYLLAYARSIQSNPLWKAVAGVFRGRIPELVKPSYKYTSAQCDVLQGRAAELDGEGDNGTYAINPICYRRYSGFAGGFNYVLNGNRTLLEPSEKGVQATNFLNVRALITEISKTLYDASVTYTFEQNSDVLWVNFKSLITPLLDKMQSGEGIAGYRLDRIKTNKKARLCARLTIVPIEAVEDFELEIYLEDSIDASLEVLG